MFAFNSAICLTINVRGAVIRLSGRCLADNTSLVVVGSSGLSIVKSASCVLSFPPFYFLSITDYWCSLFPI